MNIAIVDDTKEHRDLVKTIVSKWGEKNQISNLNIKEFSNGEALLFNLEEEDYDLIFLDIIMPNLDGIELAEKLRASSNKTFIVFLTGEESYVFKGYKLKVFDYILKPIKEDNIFSVLDRMKSELNEVKASLILVGSFGIKKIIIEDIVYLESQNKDIIFNYLDKDDNISKIKIRGTLEGFIKEIDERSKNLFSMPHRSYYCNLSKIDSIDKNNIYLDDVTITISRIRKDEFISSYLSYMRKNRG